MNNILHIDAIFFKGRQSVSTHKKVAFGFSLTFSTFKQCEHNVWWETTLPCEWQPAVQLFYQCIVGYKKWTLRWNNDVNANFRHYHTVMVNNLVSRDKFKFEGVLTSTVRCHLMHLELHRCVVWWRAACQELVLSARDWKKVKCSKSLTPDR